MVEYVELRNVLKRSTEQITLDDKEQYKQVTLRLWGKGVTLRNIVYGNEIKADKRYVAKEGQYVISKIDARNGASGLIPFELNDAVVSSDFLLFDIDIDKIYPEYLMYLSKTEWFIGKCKNASSGTTNRVRLNESRFLSIKIPLISLNEQIEAINKVKNSVEFLSKMKHKIDKEKELVELFWNKALEQAFKGFLVENRQNEGCADDLLQEIAEEKKQLLKEKKIKKGKALPPINSEEIPYDIPENWKWVKLDEIGTWGSGATPSRSNPKFYNGETPWLKTGELNDGIIYDSEEKITELALEKSSVRLNPKGSVLIAMYGATIGKLGILDIEATTNQACCACVPYSGVSNKYLFYYLLSQRENFKKQGVGGAQPNISKDKIVNHLMPLCPLLQQDEIVKEIDTIKNVVDALMEKIHKKQLLLKELEKKVFQEFLLLG
jgi:type I restriction enzyme, S subunit